MLPSLSSIDTLSLLAGWTLSLGRNPSNFQTGAVAIFLLVLWRYRDFVINKQRAVISNLYLHQGAGPALNKVTAWSIKISSTQAGTTKSRSFAKFCASEVFAAIHKIHQCTLSLSSSLALTYIWELHIFRDEITLPSAASSYENTHTTLIKVSLMQPDVSWCGLCPTLRPWLSPSHLSLGTGSLHMTDLPTTPFMWEASFSSGWESLAFGATINKQLMVSLISALLALWQRSLLTGLKHESHPDPENKHAPQHESKNYRTE